jgi:hypothetical protein
MQLISCRKSVFTDSLPGTAESEGVCMNRACGVVHYQLMWWVPDHIQMKQSQVISKLLKL